MRIIKKMTIRSIAFVFCFLSLILTLGCSPQYKVSENTPEQIKNSVESSLRKSDDKNRDFNRKPAEVLTLSELKSNDSVVEFAAFGHYYSTMISNVIGNSGTLNMYDLPYMAARYTEQTNDFLKNHTNTNYLAIDYNSINLPSNIDVVFNVLYYHDLSLNKIDTKTLNNRIFNALKPGGVFLVIDHNAEAGSGIRDVSTLHRIDPSIIKSEILAAGFELVLEDTQLLSHPEDKLTEVVFSKSLRGKTDRTVFKFRKPK